MSFRARLTSFFVVIVVLPMVAIGLLAYRLITDSQQAKAEARANGMATAAASLYASESSAARADARAVAINPGLLTGAGLRSKLSAVIAQTPLVRIRLMEGSRTLADVGDRTAIAPGVTQASVTTGGGFTVIASEQTAAAYVRRLAGPGSVFVVREGERTLGSSLPAATSHPFPGTGGPVTLGGMAYQAAPALTLPGFDSAPVRVTVLSSLAASAGSGGTAPLLVALLIVGFLLLAFAFSVLASRALHSQVSRFLQAARRLAGGDFSSPVPTEGRDEFAALGQEFNNMSSELARRLGELSQERARLRESIRRIGAIFASNLDRPALLELALQTAVDAVEAECGRVSVRSGDGATFSETSSVGSLAGFEDGVYQAERAALRTASLGEGVAGDVNLVSVALGTPESGAPTHGLITVGRRARPYSDDEREVLGSLAAQATLALENVDLHFQIRRQAVTDELTGLANRGRFQELLGAEVDQVRRYHHPVGLIMLDIDDFKSINDTFGHQQGDTVLKAVAHIVRENSREADSPARYGGEEMALILPHTDLVGAHAIGERVRTAIAALRIPRIDRDGTVQTTASVGVAASREGDKDTLVAAADAALYEAKRQGKNRTISASARAANVSGAQ